MSPPLQMRDTTQGIPGVTERVEVDFEPLGLGE